MFLCAGTNELPYNAVNSYLSPRTTDTVIYVVVFVALSLTLHVLALGWLAGRLELPRSQSTIRDAPVEVSISSINSSKILADPSQNLPEAGKLSSVPRTVNKLPRNKITPKYVPTAADQGPLNAETNAAVTGENLPSTQITEAMPLKTQAPQTPQEALPTTDSGVKSDAEKTAEAITEPALTGIDPLLEPPLYGKPLGPLPKPGQWVYVFHFGDYSEGRVLGRAIFSLEYDQAQAQTQGVGLGLGQPTYKLKVSGKAEGLTAWLYSGESIYTSEGLFTANGFAPLRYSEKPGKRPERSSSVNYAEQKVSFGDQKKPLSKGLLDRISVMWQLGLLLANDPSLAEIQRTIPVALLSTRNLEAAQFVSVGQEKLIYADKSFQATHFKFLPLNSANKAQIDLWYDTSRLPLPIRVRWIDDGRILDFFQLEQ